MKGGEANYMKLLHLVRGSILEMAWSWPENCREIVNGNYL